MLGNMPWGEPGGGDVDCGMPLLLGLLLWVPWLLLLWLSMLSMAPKRAGLPAPPRSVRLGGPTRKVGKAGRVCWVRNRAASLREWRARAVAPAKDDARWAPGSRGRVGEEESRCCVGGCRLLSCLCRVRGLGATWDWEAGDWEWQGAGPVAEKERMG